MVLCEALCLMGSYFSADIIVYSRAKLKSQPRQWKADSSTFQTYFLLSNLETDKGRNRSLEHLASWSLPVTVRRELKKMKLI